MNILGIDIGGTKTAVCIGNERGEIFAARRMPTHPAAGLDPYMERMRGMVEEILAECSIALDDVDRVGISAPGPLRVDQGILLEPPNNPGWTDIPIVQLCRDAFGRPTAMNNDANAGALAEYLFGSHRGSRSLIFGTNSTGFGTGIVVEGKLVQGVTDMGGEIGHYCVDPEGPPCPCGKRGCLELYIGGLLLSNRLKALIREQNIETAVIEKAGGDIENVNIEALAAAARDGDPFAVEQWEIFTDYVALGLSTLIMVINPEVIMLGTIAVRQGDFYLDPIRRKLPQYTWTWNHDACEVIASSLGDRIGNLAALAVALEPDADGGVGHCA